MSLRKKLIGDRDFYRRLLAVMVPVLIQNIITNFVNLLDNVMVGRVGTEPMSGVAIVNQLIFVVNLCVFGGMSGLGIFTAQFYGSGDDEGIRQTVRAKVWVGLGIVLASFLVFTQFGTTLIGTYLNGDGSGGDLAATMGYAQSYLRVILLYVVPFVMSQIYAQTLRECGETVVPMVAGVIAVFINLFLNYVLIYGKFGAPELGVVGAAWATVVARTFEMLLAMLWTHLHPRQFTFVKGLYSSMRVPLNLAKRLVLTGTPLLLNETLWAIGMAMLNQCYSYRGLMVVAAFNIATTISNVFNTSYLALGNATSILVGQKLGAGDMEGAKDTDNKMIAFSVLSSIAVGIILMLFSPVFPHVYNTSAETRSLAMWIILLTALFMPQNAFITSAYFTVRSGGKTLITFFFDSFFVCAVSVPVAFLLSRFTAMHVLGIFIMVNACDWIKCIIGFILVKRDVWMQNIVDNL